MKFNITPKDCKFIVDSKNKKTICILNNSKFLFVNFIEDNFDFPSWAYDDGDLNFYRKLSMPNRFVGIATCGPDDEWDEKIGRMIAFSRMKDNLNKSFFKKANFFVTSIDKKLDKAVDLFNIIGQKLEVNQQHRHQLIESLIGKEE